MARASIRDRLWALQQPDDSQFSLGSSWGHMTDCGQTLVVHGRMKGWRFLLGVKSPLGPRFLYPNLFPPLDRRLF